ncbi:unnamed protein product [Auanema sp. JU1783]|nr:unnamed protein product [Auanema sp. JU1783]
MQQQYARPHPGTARLFSFVHESPRESRWSPGDHAYEEFKKIVVLAGAFFFVIIICVMSKLQVGPEDVLRWSPIVWLIGVCTAGAIMNFIFYCQKKYQEKKRRRRNVELEQLYALPIPLSFPCLAPPPHIDCCRAGSVISLPTYDDVVREKEEEELPPAYGDAVAMLPQTNNPSPV